MIVSMGQVFPNVVSGCFEAWAAWPFSPPSLKTNLQDALTGSLVSCASMSPLTLLFGFGELS
jgi:hypothetical protein